LVGMQRPVYTHWFPRLSGQWSDNPPIHKGCLTLQHRHL